jgi:hypothetical protein
MNMRPRIRYPPYEPGEDKLYGQLRRITDGADVTCYGTSNAPARAREAPRSVDAAVGALSWPPGWGRWPCGRLRNASLRLLPDNR